MTIKQIIDAQQAHPDAEFKADGHEIRQVSWRYNRHSHSVYESTTNGPQLTFVGQIHSISTQTTNTTYKLDDGTGMIEVKYWTDSDAPEGPTKVGIEENAYIRVWGRLKAFNNKRHVVAHIIRPVTDPNEISMHLLEATYVHLFFTRGPPESLQSGGNGANGTAGGMFVDQPDGAVGATSHAGPDARGMSPRARQVFSLLQNAPQNNEGLHVAHIAAQLGLPQNDVFKAGDELLGAGLIYTTVDDETWAVLD